MGKETQNICFWRKKIIHKVSLLFKRIDSTEQQAKMRISKLKLKCLRLKLEFLRLS